MCPRLAVKASRCEVHAAPILAERQQQKNLYASAQHKAWRKVILMRDRVCRHCHKAPATRADHVKALKAGGDWSYDNGEGLCLSCHGRKSVKQDGALALYG